MKIIYLPLIYSLDERVSIKMTQPPDSCMIIRRFCLKMMPKAQDAIK